MSRASEDVLDIIRKRNGVKKKDDDKKEKTTAKTTKENRETKETSKKTSNSNTRNSMRDEVLGVIRTRQNAQKPKLKTNTTSKGLSIGTKVASAVSSAAQRAKDAEAAKSESLAKGLYESTKKKNTPSGTLTSKEIKSGFDEKRRMFKTAPQKDAFAHLKKDETSKNTTTPKVKVNPKYKFGVDNDTWEDPTKTTEMHPGLVTSTMPLSYDEVLDTITPDRWSPERRATVESAQETIKAIGEVGTYSMAAGLADWNRAIFNSLDKFIPTEFLGDYDFVSYLNDYYEGQHDIWEAKRQKSLEGHGDTARTFSDFGKSASSIAPDVLLALLTYGESASLSGGKIAASSSSIVQNMLKSPNYWMSFARTYGDDVDHARSTGANEIESVLYGFGSSGLNAAIEAGGGFQTLPGNLKGNTNPLWELAKSGLEEGGEELGQRIVSGSLEKGIYNPDKEIYSPTNPDAIINPSEMAKEYATAAALGWLMGGGQIALGKGFDAFNNLTNKTDAVTPSGTYDVDAVIETGLKTDPNSDAYKYASDMKAKRDAGIEVSSAEVGNAVVEIVKEVQREYFANTPATVEEAAEGLVNDREAGRTGEISEENAEVDTTPTEENNPYFKAPELDNGVDLDTYEAVDTDVEEVADTGAKEVVDIEDVLEIDPNEDYDSVALYDDKWSDAENKAVVAAWEAGLKNVPPDRITLTSRAQRKAYISGRLNYFEKMNKTEGVTTDTRATTPKSTDTAVATDVVETTPTVATETTAKDFADAKTLMGDKKRSVGVANGQAFVTNLDTILPSRANRGVFIPVADIETAKTEFSATESNKTSENVAKILDSHFHPLSEKSVDSNIEGVGEVRVFTTAEHGRQIALDKDVAEYFEGYNLEATFRGGKPYAIKATDNDGNVAGVALAVWQNTSGVDYTLTDAKRTGVEAAESNAVEAAYEAGRQGVPMDKVTLVTVAQVDAYNAGRMEHIKNMPKETTEVTKIDNKSKSAYNVSAKMTEKTRRVMDKTKMTVATSGENSYISDGYIAIPIENADAEFAKTEWGATRKDDLAKVVERFANEGEYVPISNNPVEGALPGIGSAYLFTTDDGRQIAIQKKFAKYFDGYNLSASFVDGRPNAIKATDKNGNFAGLALAIRPKGKNGAYIISDTKEVSMKSFKKTDEKNKASSPKKASDTKSNAIEKAMRVLDKKTHKLFVDAVDGRAYISDGAVVISIDESDVDFVKSEWGRRSAEGFANKVENLANNYDYVPLTSNPIEGVNAVGRVYVFTTEDGRQIAVQKKYAKYFDGYNFSATFVDGKPYAIKVTDDNGNLKGTIFGISKSGAEYSLTDIKDVSMKSFKNKPVSNKGTSTKNKSGVKSLKSFASSEKASGGSTESKVNSAKDKKSTTDGGVNRDSKGYTEQEYRDYGWARSNDILNAGENADYRSKFAMADSGQVKFEKSKSGEYIIPVSDIYDSTFEGINNTLVYATGTIDNPIITSVIKILEYDETSVDETRRIIYGLERRGIQPETRGSVVRYDAYDFQDSWHGQTEDGYEDNNGERRRSSSGKENTGSVKRGVEEKSSIKDSDYMSAVEKGDTATAQKMVDEAAREAGYAIKAYHGTPNSEFTVFDKNRVGKGTDQYGAGFYFASNRDAARGYGDRVIDSRIAMNNPFKIDGSSAEGVNLIDAGFDYLLTEEQAYEVIKRLPNIYDAEESILGDYYDSYWETGPQEWMIEDLAANESYRNIGYLDSDLFRNYPNELHEALRDVVGYDGVEVTFENGDKFYVAWFDNQMKSADPITYDDDGNVIPLSERFNEGKNDIRYARGEKGTDHSGQWTAERVVPTDKNGNKVKEDNKKPKSLSELIEDVRHTFGVNITTGHIRGKDVRGQYRVGTNGIRTKIANDLPTTLHELGHHLDDVHGILNSIPKDMKADIENELYNNLTELPKEKYKPSELVEEGFAEFTRKFFQNRETAAIDYPLFTDHFLKALTPKELAQIETLADEVNAYYSLDADTATSAIALYGDKAPDARTFVEKIKAKGSVLYQAWADANHGIKKFDKETGANTYKIASNAAYADAIAGNMISGGSLTDLNGQYVAPGLMTALHGLDLKNKKAYKEFGEYLVVKHGPERLAEGMRTFADDRKNSTAWMNKRQAEIEAKHPEYAEMSERLYSYWDKFMRTWTVDTGLIEESMYNSWRDRWKFYVPLNRVVNSDGITAGAKKGFANQDSTIKRAKGSGRDIVHPVDNMIANLVKIVNAGVKNNVMVEITEQAKALNADAAFLEYVPHPMKATKVDMTEVKGKLIDSLTEMLDVQSEDALTAIGIVNGLDDILTQYGRGKAGGNVITVMKNGNPEAWKINDPQLLSSLTNMSPKTMGGILDAYAVASRFMTANITGNNLVWSIFSNAPKDMMTLFTYSKKKNPVKLAVGVGGAYINKVKGESASPYYKEFLAMGGGQQNAYTADRDLSKSARNKMARKSTKNVLKKFNPNPLDWIGFVGDAVESGPRYATYKLMREQGMSPQDAFYEAMDITVNFRRGGKISRELNKVVPFFNANVQGLDKFRRWITAEEYAGKPNRKKAIVARSTSYIAASAALAALFYALNNGDEEDEKNYEQLSNYTKNTYWNIPLGDGQYFAIPKPREIGVLSSLFETCMEYGIGENDHAFDEFYSYAAENLLPAIANDIAQVGEKGVVETGMGIIGSFGLIGVFGYMGANRDFLGRPIVSSGLQNLEAKDQYTDRTSKIAYWLGQATNSSPQQIDFFFQQVLGGWWKTQKALFPVGGESVDYTLGVRNTYVKDNQYSLDITNWLYDRADTTSRAKASNPTDIDKAIEAKWDSNMTSFYGTYYKQAKNKSDTTATRATRQTVLDMIYEYQKGIDNGYKTKTQEAVEAVCREQNSTEFLPAVMNVEIKDGNDKKHTLSDVQYVEYQTDYLRIYWETIEDNLPNAESEDDKARIITAAKKVAKEQATARALSRIGAPKSKFTETYDGVSNDDLIEFFTGIDEADDDKSLKKTEVVDIIHNMDIDSDDAWTLYFSKYDDKGAKSVNEAGVSGNTYMEYLEKRGFGEGEKKYTKSDVVDAIQEIGVSDDDAWALYLGEYDDAGALKVHETGVGGNTYVKFRDTLDEVDKPTESGKYGTYTQDEAKEAIRKLTGISNRDRAILWQTMNKKWKPKNNPWRKYLPQKYFRDWN